MGSVEKGIDIDAAWEDPSIMVVLAVAAYTNRQTDDLPPLYYAVDPDALDAFIRSISAGEVSFTYADHSVTVAADGSVSVDPMDGGDPSADSFSG